MSNRFAADFAAAEGGRNRFEADFFPQRRRVDRPQAFARAAADGLTLGFGDEIRGGLHAASDAVFRGADFGEVYGRERDASRQRLREAREDRPLTTFLGGLGGGIATGSGLFSAARALGAGGRAALYGSSALEGGLYGAGSAEGGAEQRALGAVVGAPLGLLGAGLGEMVGQGVRAVTRQGIDRAAQADQMMLRSLEQSTVSEADMARRLVRQQRMKPATARAQARQLAQSGRLPNMTLDDVRNRAAFTHNRARTPMMLQMSPLWRRDARAVQAVGGPGQTLLDETINSRRAQIGPDIANNARAAFLPTEIRSPGGRGRSRKQRAAPGGIENQPPLSGLGEFRERFAIARTAQNRMSYDAAYAQQLTPQQQQAAMRRIGGPGFKARARQEAIGRAEEEIVRLSDDLDDLTARRAPAAEIAAVTQKLTQAQQARQALETLQPEVMNPMALDFYQRGLRSLSDAAGGAATEAGRNIFSVRRTFMENLRSVAPGLHEAIGNARAFASVDDALEAGRNIFRESDAWQSKIDDLLRSNLSREEGDAFMIGALDAIEQRLMRGDSRFIRQLQANKNWRDLVARSARSAKAATHFLRAIDDAVDEFSAYDFVQGGSPTARIGEDVRRLTSDGEALNLLDDVISSGEIKAPAMRGLGRAWNNFRRPGIYNPDAQRELAQRLTMPATINNVEELALRLAAQKRNPTMFTPEAQRNIGLGGVAAANVAVQGGERNPEWREFGGGPSFVRAGQAFGRGDYLGAGMEAGVGSLSLFPYATRWPLLLGASGLAATGAGIGSVHAGDDPYYPEGYY